MTWLFQNSCAVAAVQPRIPYVSSVLRHLNIYQGGPFLETFGLNLESWTSR